MHILRIITHTNISTLYMQGHATVRQVFSFTGKADTVVAGLLVEQGSLRLSGQSGMYIYKVLRKGVSVAVVTDEVEEGGVKMVKEREMELMASKIKKFKDNVTEVRIMSVLEFTC